jgi:hypothetical protein
MARVVAMLAPEAGPKATVSIYLSAETVIDRTDLLADLPPAARRLIVLDRQAYPLVRDGPPGSQTLRAAVRSRLHVEIGDKPLLEEAVRQLERPVDKARVRLLALIPGGPDRLVRTAKPDPSNGRPALDPIDPAKLPGALSSVGGQTVVISGRIAGGLLTFRPSRGLEQTLPYEELTAAAARAGVDLFVVQSPTPHQPDGRSWLWQRFAIGDLDKALERGTLADKLETLAGAKQAALVTLASAGPERFVMRVGPPEAFAPGGGGFGGMLREVTTSLSGRVSATAVELNLTSADRRQELALRLLPMVPSSLQTLYLLALAVGLAGSPAAWRWWGRLWPAEAPTEYAGAAGYQAARAARLAVFLAVFLPVVAVPALLATLSSLVVIGGCRLLSWRTGAMSRHRDRATETPSLAPGAVGREA